MQNEKFKNAIHEAMERDYKNLSKASENHIFSPKFEKRMDRLTKRRNKPYYRFINTSVKRAVCIAASVLIVSSTAIISVDALRNRFIDFCVGIYEKFSIVKSVKDNNAPETIEDIYEITYDLSGFTIDYEEYNEYMRDITYVKDDIDINFTQNVKEIYDVDLNTEEAEKQK